MSDFELMLSQKVKYAETVLEKYLPSEKGYAATIMEAIRYSVKAGGKRLRPVMMYETYCMFGGNEDVIEPFMAAQEMIHNYSLIHDDLEVMDNDEYRRGMKTTHVVYGEAMAVLAGDGLLNLAYETAAKAFTMKPGSVLVEKAFLILSQKAGIYGMVGGQVVDVESENNNKMPDMDTLLYIHENKTAALISSALTIGAVLAGAEDKDVELLNKVGYNVGLAFQIQDDILDVTGTYEELGKPIGSDEKNQKVTYVSLNGLEKSRQMVEKLSKEAEDILSQMPGDSSFLRALIDSLIYRKK